MVDAITNIWIAFLAGLFAPTGAVCVIPLYPGFLAYLSNQLSGKESRYTTALIGGIVTLGVLSSMFLFGFIFIKFLEASITEAIEVVSPVAFVILLIVSILLIFNVDIGRFFPKVKTPVTKNPVLSSLGFGFFFGAIVLPCNPGSLIVLFAISTTTMDFIANFFNFFSFGIGMAFPLLFFSLISTAKSRGIIEFLTKYNRKINLFAGIIMLVISLYYLVIVFKVFG